MLLSGRQNQKVQYMSDVLLKIIWKSNGNGGAKLGTESS